MTDILQGRRIPDNEWFQRQADGKIEPGDYGRQRVHNEAGEDVWAWFNCTPDGEIGMLAVHAPDSAGNFHVVTEHEDGTISVGGSIRGQVVKGIGPILARNGWHGWLERGIWRTA